MPKNECLVWKIPEKYVFFTIFFAGDEIFSVNGRSVAGLTHQEAIGIFKEIKVGSISVTIGRREQKKILKISEDL